MKLIPSVRLSNSEIANFENVLVTRIIETGNLKAVIARKILSDFFLLPETRQAYNYILKHYQKFNTTPSMELFRDKFRAFPLRSTNDSVEVICDEIRRNKLYVDMAEMMEEALKYNRTDPYEALDHLRGQMASLTSQHIVTRDSDITKEIAQARDDYMRAKEGEGLIGVPWPWPKLNEVTLGVQNGEVVYFYGRPKSGKTWWLIASAVEAFKKGRRPLLISKEMPTEQIRRRVLAVFTKVDYSALRTGKLPPQEEKRFFDDLEAFAENPPFILSGDDEDKGGVMSVGAKIKEYSPDIVYLDGVYLMHDDRTNKRTTDWQGVSHITQDLKRLAKQMDIPIVGTTQGNRASAKSKGDNKEETAFSDAFVQDADYLIRIIYEKSHEEDREAIITIPAIREAAGCTFTVNAKFASDLSQKYSAESDEDADTILAGTDAGSLIL